ncbi:MAG TPA: tetratricopeptide repeat protein, partial [Holophagaceae bacterium]
CQRAGDLPGALRAVEEALSLAPGHPQLLRLKRDLLFAAGRLEDAAALNGSLLNEQPRDPQLRVFQIYLWQRQGRLAEALEAATRLLEAPELSEGLRHQVRLVQADLFQSQGRPAEALRVLAPLTGESGLDVQSRRAFLLLATEQPDEAMRSFQSALALAPGPGEPRRTLLLGLRDAARAAGKPEQELGALKSLHDLDPKDRRIALDLAYAYLARGRDREALSLFSTALDAQSPPGAWLDAGYAAKRLGRNAEAAADFSRGLDARAASGVRAPAFDYGLRREVEGLERTWGLVSGTAFRQGGLLPGTASQQRILQEGLEAYWQPARLARNGRLVQVYAQVFETLHAGQDGVTGGPTLQGVLGIRAKPFASENLVVGVQKLVKLGRYSLDDWMFRAAYSRDEGLDLRPWQDRWTCWSFYTEGADFARSGHYIHQMEGRVGWAYRPEAGSGRNVWWPHLVVAGDYDNRLAPRAAGGIGLGASVRHWFREDRHRAPASWIELTVQGRARVSPASRGGGLFLTLTCWF